MEFTSEHFKKPKRALILQGDWEGGLSRVALDMMMHGVEVTKVVLTAADWVYKLRKVPTVSYKDKVANFESWLRKYVAENDVDCLILYNQYRPYNAIGWDLAKELGIECLVFELGLLRPDFCTLYSQDFDHFEFLKGEWGKMLEDLEEGEVLEPPVAPQHLSVMSTPRKLVKFGWYFLFTRIMCLFGFYRNYRDQRSMSFWLHLKGLVMSGLRAQGRFKQRRFDQIFSRRLRDKYYFVPLQVHCDSQIKERSDFDSMIDFIDRVVESFERFAPEDTQLVFKVHPVDRGYIDYHEKIKEINVRLGGRVHYLDLIHLPTALDHCLGCVTVNSSVGLSALIHQKKLMCLGEAAFDLQGLTFQGELDEFWNSEFMPQRNLVDSYVALLKQTSQAYGVLYQRLYMVKGHCKIAWPPLFSYLFKHTHSQE